MGRLLCLGAAGMAALLAGCTAGGGDAPRRPVVDRPDQIGTIDRELIVGTWQCRELNPYPNAPLRGTTITYRGDGSFESQGRSETQGPLGAILAESRGQWQVQGDRIVASNVTTTARAADGNPMTNVLAGLGASIANSIMAWQDDGTSDVLTLTGNELVMRPIGVEDPPVIACMR